MKNTMPRTPFSTPLSGSAREVELRLKNIFSGPKRRPPVPFLALVFAVCLLCVDLVSCQMAEAPPPNLSLATVDWEEMLYASRVLSRLVNGAERAATADITIFDAAPDLNRNGVPEELRLIVPADYGSGQQLEVWEDGRRIFMEQGDQVHAGYNAIFLCTLDGEDYLLRYNPYMGQWVAGYHYWLFTLEEGAEQVVRQNELYFDINFGYPAPDSGIRDPDEFFDPEEINAFMEEINGLLSRSVQLLNTDQELLSTFEKEGRLEDTLWFLDAWEPIFRRDPSKSLLENLYDFRDAMAAYVQR